MKNVRSLVIIFQATGSAHQNDETVTIDQLLEVFFNEMVTFDVGQFNFSCECRCGSF